MRATEATEEELLNRIAAIQAAAEILDDNHELSHGDRRAFLTVIQIETARLQALVRQIAFVVPRLPAARIGNPCDAAHLIDHVVFVGRPVQRRYRISDHRRAQRSAREK